MRKQNTMIKYSLYWKCFLFVLLIIFMFGGCKKTSERIDMGGEPFTDSMTEQPRSFRGVVTAIDTNGQSLSLYNISSEENTVLSYSGATNFFSKNEKQMTAVQLELGEIVDIYKDENFGKLTKVQISNDIIIDDNVQNVSVYSDESYLSYQEKKFKYKSGVIVFSDNKLIDIMEISPMDIVTVRGVEGLIYSITVNTGHGYIRPSHYSEFIGGRMTIDGQTIIGITKNMLVPIREGTYEVTMKKGDFIGTRSVVVPRNVEAKIDMSIFKNQKPDVGQVLFEILPEGAEVYVDGKEVDISAPVTLTYGKHKIAAILEGYTAYTGTLDVQSANPTVKVDLAEEEAEVEGDDYSTSDESSSPSPVYDNEHKITVSEPKGVEVYLDGVYKGTAPVSFAKIIGTHTITLSKSGYTTKSYTIQIIKDDEDILWNFAALNKKADG